MYFADDHVKRHPHEANQGTPTTQSTPFPASSSPAQWFSYDPNQTTSQSPRSPFQPQSSQIPPNQFMLPAKSPFAQTATTTGQLPADSQDIRTEDLPNDPNPVNTGTGWVAIIPASPRITRQLTEEGPRITSRLTTHIPATEKRPERTPKSPPPRKRRPIALICVLISCGALLVFGIVYSTPLASGQSIQSLLPPLINYFQPNNDKFNTGAHIAPPTPTPALLTNNGYCGGTDIWGTCATAITDSGLMGTGAMQAPIAGSNITQYFGNPEYQSFCGCWRPHSGIDLATAYGTQIVAADSGQVIWTGWDWSGLGWAVKINHGHYIATIYGHMARYVVKVGQNVTKGQVVGYEGSTGASTGPHLHFMVLVNNIWLDPLKYVALP